jgi:hypothetical protein
LGHLCNIKIHRIVNNLILRLDTTIQQLRTNKCRWICKSISLCVSEPTPGVRGVHEVISKNHNLLQISEKFSKDFKSNVKRSKIKDIEKLALLYALVGQVL